MTIRGSSNQELLKEGAAVLICKGMVPFPVVLEHVALFPFRGQLLSAKMLLFVWAQPLFCSGFVLRWS